MHRGYGVNAGDRIAPIELFHRTDFLRPQKASDAKGRYEPGRVQAFECGEVQVIVVIVADEDNIQAGQIFQADSRTAMAERSCERDGAGAFGPDGIGQQVYAAGLE